MGWKKGFSPTFTDTRRVELGSRGFHSNNSLFIVAMHQFNDTHFATKNNNIIIESFCYNDVFKAITSELFKKILPCNQQTSSIHLLYIMNGMVANYISQ